MTEVQKKKRAKYKERKKAKEAQIRQAQLGESSTSMVIANNHYDTSDDSINVYTQSSGITTVRHYKNNR